MTADIDVLATVAGKQDVIKITFLVTEHVSLAYHENAVPVVREAMVEYASERDLSDIRVEIESRPQYNQPLTLRIDRILAAPNHHIALPDVLDQIRRAV